MLYLDSIEGNTMQRIRAQITMVWKKEKLEYFRVT